MHEYRCWNGAMPTIAALPAVATGTAIKTMLQLSTPSTRQMKIISWGFSLDALQQGVVELIQTDVAATVTAHLASGVMPLDPNAPPSLLTLGVNNTGFTASAEGVPTAVRLFDTWTTGPSASAFYTYQFVPDERPTVAVSKFVRIRATFGTTVNMRCWVCWDE
jgi:hypothetical protein